MAAALFGEKPLLCVGDVSQDEFRKGDDKLSQPRVLFKQRHDIVVGVLVVIESVTSKRRFNEASLRSMRCGSSHGQSPIAQMSDHRQPDNDSCSLCARQRDGGYRQLPRMAFLALKSLHPFEGLGHAGASSLRLRAGSDFKSS